MITKEQLREELRYLAVKVENEEESNNVCKVFEFAGFRAGFKYFFYPMYISMVHNLSDYEYPYYCVREQKSGQEKEISYLDFIKKYGEAIGKGVLETFRDNQKFESIVDIPVVKDSAGENNSKKVSFIEEKKQKVSFLEAWEWMKKGNKAKYSFFIYELNDGILYSDFKFGKIEITNFMIEGEWELIEDKKTLFQKMCSLESSPHHERFEAEDVKEAIKNFYNRIKAIHSCGEELLPSTILRELETEMGKELIEK
jgi:hypothetical protein